MKAAEPSLSMLQAELPSPAGLLKEHTGKKLREKCLALVYPVTTAKVYCCFTVLIVLFMSVVVLSFALLVRIREEVIKISVNASCPKSWIGFADKCFYFSEDTRNWTFSQIFCMKLEAQLALFESLEELNFLRRYKGDSDHWIGLHRESSEHVWKWMDGTEYNSLVSIRGVGEHAYLHDNGISTARVSVDRKWICSKPNSLTQCQLGLNSP